MTESRLQRWSRRKTEVSKKSEPTPVLPVENEQSPEEQELAVNETLPEHEVLEKYGLPEPEAIELGTDITGFMRKEIPELLRRKALRALWKSNPVLAVLDGLNDYDEDYTAAATGTHVVKTLYKVGQGMFDKSARAAERLEEQSNEPVGIAELEESAPSEGLAELNELKTTAESPEPLQAPEPEAVDAVEEETEAAPLYRPRMRFE